MSPANRLFLVLSGITVGVIALSLALFYGIAEGESGPLPLREVLFGLVDYAAERDSTDEGQMEAYLNSVGWSVDRFEGTIDNILEDNPELFWELMEDLESYAWERYGLELWELGLG
ncbi:hypothetical protein KAU45_05195 [bacterium]|nr:hypothetical protein [bacterium]